MTTSPVQVIFEKIFSLENIHNKYENDFCGKSVVGIDGMTGSSFAKNKDMISHLISKKCLEGTYNFSPYLEVLILKGRNKTPRMLAVPTLRDQMVLSLLKDALHHRDCFSSCLQKKLPNQIIREIDDFHRAEAEYHFLKTDISGFYDNIEREILMNILRKKIQDKPILTLIFKAIVNPIVPRDYEKQRIEIYRTSKGIPQGLAISNILSDIYMCDFDRKIFSLAKHYVRYVDDILVMYDKSREFHIRQRMKSHLTMLSLQMNAAKTYTGPANQKYDFLGYIFNGDKVSVRKSTRDKFMQSLANMFKNEKKYAEMAIKKYENRIVKYLGQEILTPKLTIEDYKTIFVEEVNEKITGAIASGRTNNELRRYGWIFYFSRITDITMLAQIDAFIQNLFRRSELFANTVPIDLKSIVQAHRKINYRLKSRYDGYIHDYTSYSTLIEKLKYIQFRIPLLQSVYTEDEINELFNQLMERKLRKLHVDIGHIS